MESTLAGSEVMHPWPEFDSSGIANVSGSKTLSFRDVELVKGLVVTPYTIAMYTRFYL